MRHWNDCRLYAASDLAAFLGCRHRTLLDLTDLDAPQERAPDDPIIELLKQKGEAHEQEYPASLRASGLDVVEVDGAGTLEARADATLAAMREGTDVVYQAVLLREPWHGYADFLRRTEADTSLGAHGYEVVDTKLGRSPTPYHLLQIALYSDLVGTAQEMDPHGMHLVLGDGSEASFRVAEFADYYRSVRGRFEACCDSPPADSYPLPCSHCPQCPWRERCEAQWEADDHLSRVAEIRRDQVAKLERAGVDTVAALAALPPGTAVPKLAPSTLERLRAQGSLQQREGEGGEPAVETIPAEPGRGFALLPAPDPGDIFLDIEGDPLYPDGLEYLFGLLVPEPGGPAFTAEWAHDHEGECAAFERLVDRVAGQLAAHPGAHVYHYGHYEESALKRLSTRYATREAEVDDLLRGRRLVDLYKVARGAIRTSRPGMSPKDLEIFFAAPRTGDVSTAAESVVVYERWRQSGDDTLLEEIRRYNEVDCRSTAALRDWLVGLRPAGTPWRAVIEAAEAQKSERIAEEEAEFREMERRLLDGAPVPERPLREAVRDLLEFHRREAKPQWWAMFDRQARSDEELVDDAECLGELESTGDPVPDKRSLLHTYRFPEQDTKLSIGARPVVAATLEPAGEITELDDRVQRVVLRRGAAKGPLPPSLSIIPGGPFDTRALRGALYRFAASIASGGGRYRAIEDLLERRPPRIRGRREGQPVVAGTGDLLVEAGEAVAAIDESALFIQGPPGAGKTFTASHLIADLLASGRRVGIASNSHKAINNLLLEVEQRADARGLDFRGVKRSDPRRPETCFEGAIVGNAYSNDDVDTSADLIAGTAFLFAREELDAALDYLFLDEAGQISLANAVAMGTAARNLVLVGDQMPLGQPIQGVHPGRSGGSVLEHLLEDRATILPDRGIFLPTTWRMHEDVCGFISDAVYDGRLYPEKHNANQRLVLRAGAHPVLAPTGIRFVPVEHEGCSQRSDEEAELVAALHASLLDQRFRDRTGKTRGMTADDVLVVAPYNVQVNRLTERLAPGARVGTVDKFQGQQAPVVLVSMTTSSAEDLPRHTEFLYSRNRLNVAVSRARALAVVIASPRLLEIDCRTVEQMRLVNTLCWLREYGGDPSGTSRSG